jgi:hypothetical protein
MTGGVAPIIAQVSAVAGQLRGTDFTNFIATSPHIDVASQAEIDECGLDDVRIHPANIIISRAFGIQPKDASIVSLAVAYADEIDRRDSDEKVTIYTSDRTFARFEPADYDLGVEMLPYR